MTDKKPVALVALDATPRSKPSNYPKPFASMMTGRIKRQLGDQFGLNNFGVNLTVIAPGGMSALRHSHSRQDEFIYILSGTATLHTDEGMTELEAGMCAGFKAGDGNAHRLVNNTKQDMAYLEIGDRSAGDEVNYPDDDIAATLVDGKWKFFHKNGKPY